MGIVKNVEVTLNYSSGKQIKFATPLIDGVMNPCTEECWQPALLMPWVTQPRLKVLAAEFHGRMLSKCIRNEASAIFHIDATLSALRSATFVLQKVCHNKEGFEAWYIEKQRLMGEDSLLRTLKLMRNESEKEGLRLIEFRVAVDVREHNNGEVDYLYRDPILKIDGHQLDNVLSQFEEAANKIHQVVEEAHTLGFVDIPTSRVIGPDLHHWKQNKDGAWAESQAS